jgi:chromosome segregation ATPase
MCVSTTIRCLDNFRIDEDDMETYLRQFYDFVLAIGLRPEDAAEHISDLHRLSTEARIRLSQLPSYLQELQAERLILDQEVPDLQKRADKAKLDLQETQNMHKEFIDNLREYLIVREGFSAAGISANDFSALARLVANCKTLEFDAARVLGVASRTDSLKEQESDLVQEVKALQEEVNNWQSSLENMKKRSEVYSNAIQTVMLLGADHADLSIIRRVYALAKKYAVNLEEFEGALASYGHYQALIAELVLREEEAKKRLEQTQFELQETTRKKMNAENEFRSLNESIKHLRDLSKDIPNELRIRADEIIQKHIELLTASKDQSIVKYLGSKFAPLVSAEFNLHNDSSRLKQAIIEAISIAESLPGLSRETKEACERLSGLLTTENT